MEKAKKIFVMIAPVLLALIGLIVFLVYFVPKYSSYREEKKTYDQTWGRITEFRRNAKDTAIERVVKARRQEKELLDQEFWDVETYLSKTYTYHYPERYKGVSPLGFKNLVLELRKNLDRKQVGFEQFDDAVPAEDMLPDLLMRLEITEMLIKILQGNRLDMIDNYQISKGQIVNNEATGQPLYEEFVATVYVRASYDALLTLLYTLEHSQNFFIVNHCHMKGVEGDEFRVGAGLSIKAIRFLFSSAKKKDEA